MISRSNARGGPYPKNCKPCFDRYWKAPTRITFEESMETMRQQYKKEQIKLNDKFIKGEQTDSLRKQLLTQWEEFKAANPFPTPPKEWYHQK